MLVQIRINSIVAHTSWDGYKGNRITEVSEIVMKRPSEIPKQSSSDPCQKVGPFKIPYLLRIPLL